MIVVKDIGRDMLLSNGKKLDFALLYRISEVHLMPAEQLEAKHLDDECQEARIFSDSEEYHMFEFDGVMRIVHIIEDDIEDVIDRTYKLSSKMKAETKASVLHVRSYIGYDDDGQAYTKLTRLFGVK